MTDDFDDRMQMIAIHKTEHGMEMNPWRDIPHFVRHIVDNLNGRCPCIRERPSCPCKESVDEVKTKGQCACGLYWSKEKVKEWRVKEDQSSKVEKAGRFSNFLNR